MTELAIEEEDIFSGYQLEGQTAERIRIQQEIEDFGFVGKALCESAIRKLKEGKTFEIPEHLIERDAKFNEQKEKLLYPKSFRELKLPSMTHFMGESGNRFEQPLFKESQKLRKFLIPISVACSILELEEWGDEEIALMGALLNALRMEMTDELRNLHYRRMVAKVDDPEARSILMAEKDHIFRSETAKNVLTDAKAMKKLSSSLLPPKRLPTIKARGGRVNRQRSNAPSSSTSSPSSPSSPSS